MPKLPPSHPLAADFTGLRRGFLGGGLAALSGLALPGAVTAQPVRSAGPAEVAGQEYWAVKKADGQDVRLFIWRKQLRNAGGIPRRGTIVFVHGSSVSSTPVFDLQIPGRTDSSTTRPGRSTPTSPAAPTTWRW